MFVHKGFTFSYLFLGWFLYMEVGHLSRCAVCLGDHLSRIFAQCAGVCAKEHKSFDSWALFKFFATLILLIFFILFFFIIYDSPG